MNLRPGSLDISIKPGLACLGFAIGVLSAVSAVSAADPNANAGEDAGPPYIAVIGGGIDYRKPEVAKRLARDGEGVPIAWDFVDADATPFEAEADLNGPHGTLIRRAAKGSLVVVRVPSGDVPAFVRAVGFVAQTPARVVVTPAIGTSALMLAWVRAAAARFPNLLFVAPAGTGGHDLDDLKATPLEEAGRQALPPQPAPEVSKLRNLIIATSEGGTNGNVGPQRVHLAVALRVPPAPATQTVDPSTIAAATVAAMAADLLAKRPDMKPDALAAPILARATNPQTAKTRFGTLQTD